MSRVWGEDAHSNSWGEEIGGEAISKALKTYPAFRALSRPPAAVCHRAAAAPVDHVHGSDRARLGATHDHDLIR